MFEELINNLHDLSSPEILCVVFSTICDTVIVCWKLHNSPLGLCHCEYVHFTAKWTFGKLHWCFEKDIEFACDYCRHGSICESLQMVAAENDVVMVNFHRWDASKLIFGRQSLQ